MNKIIFEQQINYINSFRNEANTLLLEMETYSKNNRVPILDIQSAELLEILVRFQQPKRVLEIGTAIGYSTIRIARSLSKNSVIHTIEKSEDNIKLADENLEKSGLKEKIVLLKGEAAEIMMRLQKKYDFIFLDADKEDYLRLFDYSMILLKKGGMIFVDNLLWHGFAAAEKVPKTFKNSTKYIREFNKVFMNQPNLKATILTIGDGIGIGLKVKNKKNTNNSEDKTQITENS
jgi:predicted O-methyltransferase YrrM